MVACGAILGSRGRFAAQAAGNSEKPVAINSCNEPLACCPTYLPKYGSEASQYYCGWLRLLLAGLRPCSSGGWAFCVTHRHTRYTGATSHQRNHGDTQSTGASSGQLASPLYFCVQFSFLLVFLGRGRVQAEGDVMVPLTQATPPRASPWGITVSSAGMRCAVALSLLKGLCLVTRRI